MRIIAGSHRGRRIEAPPDATIRPTSDRIRESLFNILGHRLGGFADKTVLDGFAGTGALGFEALSRGAASALFMDNNKAALDLCRRSAAALGLDGRAAFRLGDIARPPAAQEKFDLVLLDPPYGKGLGSAALSALEDAGWLADNAIIVIEADKSQPEATPQGFSVIDSRDYGRTRIELLIRKP
jgi:16S rRNA (guanine966-N2)-methyltransferase